MVLCPGNYQDFYINLALPAGSFPYAWSVGSFHNCSNTQTIAAVRFTAIQKIKGKH